jgi:hypothetical protein
MTAPQQHPPVEQLGGAVLVRGRALRDLIYALSRGIAAAPQEGQGRHVPRLEAFRSIALQAWDFQMSDTRHGDVANIADLRESYAGERDWIDTAEAARRSGLCCRHIQRLAHDGLGRKVGSRWRIDADALAAYMVTKDERRQHDDTAA